MKTKNFVLSFIAVTMLLCVSCGKNITQNNKVVSCKFDSVPYNSIESINKELSSISESEIFDTYLDDGDIQNSLFIERLKYHLSNPVTFKSDISLHNHYSNPLYIVQSPDKKYKIYTYRESGGGTMATYKNFIQYKNDLEQVAYKSFLENVRFDYSKAYTNIYQFRHKENDYYVLMSCNTASSCLSSFHIEVATFQDGMPTFHTRFFPKGIFESSEITMVDWVNNDEYDAPAYDVTICEYNCYLGDVKVKYNPQTKAISYIDYDDNEKGKRVSWRLVIPKE